MVLHHTGYTSSLAGGSLLLGQIVAILLARAPMLLIPQWHSTPPAHLGPPHALLPASPQRCALLALGAQGLFCEHQVVGGGSLTIGVYFSLGIRRQLATFAQEKENENSQSNIRENVIQYWTTSFRFDW